MLIVNEVQYNFFECTCKLLAINNLTREDIVFVLISNLLYNIQTDGREKYNVAY